MRGNDALRKIIKALEIAARHRAIGTVEENTTAGGAGSGVGELLAAEQVLIPLLHLGIPDRFIEHGSREDCLAAAGLDAESLYGAVEHWWSLHREDLRLREASG